MNRLDELGVSKERQEAAAQAITRMFPETAELRKALESARRRTENEKLGVSVKDGRFNVLVWNRRLQILASRLSRDEAIEFLSNL